LLLLALDPSAIQFCDKPLRDTHPLLPLLLLLLLRPG
jgi:hypothetical protein